MRRRKVSPNTSQTNHNSQENDHTDKMRIATYSQRRKIRHLAKLFGKLAIVALLAVFLGVPIAWQNIPAIQRNLIFLPFVHWPPFLDLKQPDKIGLPATRNFYVKANDDIELGVWHILPKKLIFSGLTEADYEKTLDDGEPIILYMHGNSGSRGGNHRIELYKVLRNLDYHVITFDYRGYGDSSSSVASEEGVVADGKAMYEWVTKLAGKSQVFIWGHSLGSGVATKVVEDLCKAGNPPTGLVLESPFNNMKDEVRSHPLSKLWRGLPWFDYFFLDPLDDNKLSFPSDKRIQNIDVPILILHAEDDRIIPFGLGHRLYFAAKAHRPSNSAPVQFIRFDSHRGYGHRYICRDPGLPQILIDFIRHCESNPR